MSMADDMRDICQGIVNSRAERAERLNEIRTDTNKMLNDFSNERRKMSTELKADLKKYESSRKAAAAELRDELEKETKKKLEGFASDRKKMGKELKSELKAYPNYIGTEVGNLRKGYLKELKDLHDAWAGLSKVKPAERVFVAGKRMDIDTQITDALTSAPSGLSLPELGKKIGVNWRTLTRSVNALVKDKKIKKKKAKYLLK